MNQPLAERDLYGFVDGTELRIVVRLWPPEPYDESAEETGSWKCRFTFEGASSVSGLVDGFGAGEDKVQAIFIAMEAVGGRLDRSGIDWSTFPDAARGLNGRILPREDGFPRAELNPMFHGGSFRRRMQAMVEGETYAQSIAVDHDHRPPLLERMEARLARTADEKERCRLAEDVQRMESHLLEHPVVGPSNALARLMIVRRDLASGGTDDRVASAIGALDEVIGWLRSEAE